MDFYHLQKKYKKKLLDSSLDALNTASKKVVHKASEFLGNKIAVSVTELNRDKIAKTEPVEEIIIPPEERDEILNKILLSKLLNDSTVSNFVTKSGSK